jgi:hypothetical protein
LAEYRDTLVQNQGWLVIFDRSPDKSWNEGIYWRTQKFQGKRLRWWGVEKTMLFKKQEFVYPENA